MSNKLLTLLVLIAIAAHRPNSTALRHRHHQRPHHRRHRLALVLRRHRHPRRQDRRHRQSRRRAAQADHRRCTAKSSPRASSTCSASRSSPCSSTRACPRRSIRASPPKLPARAIRSLRSTTPSFNADRADYDHSRSRPTGAPCANISRGSKSRAWASTSPAMSAPRRSAAWCWATTMCSQRPRSSTRCKPSSRRPCRDGAVGVSTALQYAPAPYAKTDELIALAAEAAKFGGIYATHMRRRRRLGLDRQSTKPCASAAKRTSPSKSGTSKPPAKPTGDACREIVAKINAARAAGVDISGRHLRLHRLVQRLSPPSFRRGPTMAATASSSSG